MDRRETERLLDAIRQARAAGEPAALATVVRVKGSAYRREGTRMFVRQDGTYECALSGGCLEPTVAEAAARVIATGEPVIVSYDLADDSIWGLGIGCSGAVDIRIERLDDDAITREWLTMLERGEAAVLVTPLSGVSGRMIVRGTGDIVGGLTDPVVEQQAVARARDAAAARRIRRQVPSRLAARRCSSKSRMPPPDLVIFGAGHDAAPVAQLAWTLGFAVTVVDVREAFLTPDRFPRRDAGVRAFQPVRRARDAARRQLRAGHEPPRRARSGEPAVQPRIGCGLHRRARAPVTLRQAAGRPGGAGLRAGRRRGPPRVRSPVGLSLGAETPEEVAVSILGEILAIRRGFDGGFLSGSIAQPSPPGRQAALGQLVVLGRVDIHQQIRRELQDRGPLAVPLQDGTRAVLELRRARGRTHARTDAAAP